MTIMYEINPPRIPAEQNILNTHLERIELISSVCDSIHITDSVLGVPRVSPLNIAKKIRETSTSVCLQALRFGFVLTDLLVLRIIHAGTGDVCFIFLSRRIFLPERLRAAIEQRQEKLFLN